MIMTGSSHGNFRCPRRGTKPQPDCGTCPTAAVTTSKLLIAATALIAAGTVLAAAQPLADHIKDSKPKPNEWV